MKSTKLRVSLIALIAVSIASIAVAESPLNPSLTVRDNLKALMAAKQKVVVLLKNGQSYSAAIGSVGDHFVILSGPTQKEFFDVLVAIDEIAAIEARARDH